MTDWPKHLEACANCSGTSSLYAYGGHGYCTRCYRLIKHIQIAQAWNRSDRDTLKRIGKNGTIDLATGKSLGLSTDTLTDEQFEITGQKLFDSLKKDLCYTIVEKKSAVLKCLSLR
jgi:hypothetical protein